MVTEMEYTIQGPPNYMSNFRSLAGISLKITQLFIFRYRSFVLQFEASVNCRINTIKIRVFGNVTIVHIPGIKSYIWAYQLVNVFKQDDRIEDIQYGGRVARVRRSRHTGQACGIVI